MADLKTNLEHWINYASKMQRIIAAGEFCDVTLIAERKRFTTSRIVLSACSDYFQTMFTSSFKEKDSEEVEIMDVGADDLQNLINVCYAGVLKVDEESVGRLLEAAHLLQITTAISICCEFIVKELSTDNCLKFWLLAKHLMLKELEEVAFRYCLDNFMNISKTVYADLSYDELDEIIRNSALVSTARDIFIIIMTWIQHEPEARINDIIKLSTRVDFNFIKKTEFDEYIDFFRQFDEAKYFLMDMNKFYNSPTNEKLFFSSQMRNTLVPMSLTDKGLEIYQENAGEWQSLIACDLAKLTVFAAHIAENKLFIVTKSDNGQDTSIVSYAIEGPEFTRSEVLMTTGNVTAAIISYPMVYLVKTDQTLFCLNLMTHEIHLPIAKMSTPRFHPGVAVIDNILYVFGGNNFGLRGIGDVLNSTESYSFELKKWKNCASMLYPVSEMGVGVVNNKIYVLGGANGVYYMNNRRSVNSTSNEFQCYDPVLNTWSSLGIILKSCCGLSVCVYNEKILVSGWKWIDMSGRNSVYVYSPKEETWKGMETPSSSFRYLFTGPSNLMVNN